MGRVKTGFFRATLITLITLSALAANACSQPPLPAGGPTPISGESSTLKVSGEYQPVDIPQVDKLLIEHGKLLLQGASGQVAVNLPAEADQPKPGQEWMLVTESEIKGRREVTFTHEQSLDDFTLKLPVSAGALRYGTLSGKNGNDVLVFAWGREERSYWGYVTIGRQSPAARH